MKQMSLIEMDGFLKGKCIPCNLKVNETNAEYLVRKFGELESKLNEQREYYEGVISDGSKRIAELEAREVTLPAEKFCQADYPGILLWAEPVAYIFKHPAGKLFWALTDESNKEQSDVIPVYAAPPVPVVPEEKPMPNPLSMYAVDAVAAIAEVRGWNACRAAMLKGDKS